MRIAVFSDIHGNYYAFKEVLKKADQEGVEHILILGDIVGYYYSPQKILKSLSQWSIDIIKGNHENILESLVLDPSLSESVRLKYGSGHNEALKKLTQNQLNYLFNLPHSKSVIIDGISFQMNHGTPWNQNEYLYPDADIKKMNQCNSKDHDFVLMGHTHYSFTYKCNDSILINPGSVGQSREEGGYAYWALVDTKDKSYCINKTKYNTKLLVEEVNCVDPEISYNLNILLRNNNE